MACTTTLPDRLPDKLKSDVTQILSDSLPCGRILYYTVESLSETQWSRDDIPAIIEQCRDPQMMEFTRIPRPYTSEHAHQLLALARAGWQAASPTSPRFWAIAAPTATGYRFAGTIDYRPTGHRTATVGYGLHPAHRGAGLMSVALSLVLDYAFDHDGQELIHWQAAVGNWASAKAAWRNGFRLEGHVRGLCLRPDGGINDGWIATLHRDDPRTPGQPWPATT
ncbi:GNAT family N-acetyltransferase [Nocardia nova]|uniref:GNAT family N-acetyltransferase n=2 Tax=Nocardia nova TaxID=37330 RepID=UPI00379E7658